MDIFLYGLSLIILSVTVIILKFAHKEKQKFSAWAYDKENKRFIRYMGHFGRNGRVIINHSYIVEKTK